MIVDSVAPVLSDVKGTIGTVVVSKCSNRMIGKTFALRNSWLTCYWFELHRLIDLVVMLMVVETTSN